MFQSPEVLKQVLDSVTKFIEEAAQADVEITPPSELSIPAPTGTSSLFNKYTLQTDQQAATVYTPASNVLQFSGDAVLEGMYLALLLADNTSDSLKIDGVDTPIVLGPNYIFARQKIEYDGSGAMLAVGFGGVNENSIVYNIKYTALKEQFVLALGYNNAHPYIVNSQGKLFRGGYYIRPGETIYLIFSPKEVFMMYTNV